MDTEKSMRDYILEELDRYNRNALHLDKERFINEVFDSFSKSKTNRHYVLLIPADVGEYYTTEEHNQFSSQGFYRMPVENRFDNRFFIPPQGLNTAIDLLRSEYMVVEKVRDRSLPDEVAIVTLNGVFFSNFKDDFEKDNG